MNSKKNLITVIFVFALFSGCAPPCKMKALIRMIDQQESNFKNTIVADFNKNENAEIEIVHFNNADSIGYMLDTYKGQIGLVKVPFDKAWSLVREDRILPLESFVTEAEKAEFDATYMLTTLGLSGGRQYYIPRKFETRLMVYLKSKVLDAFAVWRKHVELINKELERYNGSGLPSNYQFEEDPNQWDFFDVFVAGWIWAHTPYAGKIGPKVGHRGRRYSGTSQRIIDRVFQLGGDSASVVSMKGNAVTDAFCWEAAYAASGIYNPKMWEEQWSGTGIWEGFSKGEVFLSFMTQLDCFFIHGTGYEGLKGYLANPEDMGVAVMPQGCSMELNSTGKIMRDGSKAVTTGGWWWGIPKQAPDPKMSYKLVRHITSFENQVQECSKFGMIPVRKDVLSDMQMLFGGQWISSIYEVSFKQLMHNKFTTLPGHPRFDQIGNIYLDAWFDIVVGRNWSEDKTQPNREYIKKTLEVKYIPMVEKIK